jgi:hypothetical protein
MAGSSLNGAMVSSVIGRDAWRVGTAPEPRRAARGLLGAITDEGLRWSSSGDHHERVNLGAVPEEKSGDLYRPGELQLPLAVAAFGMDEGWIVCDQGRGSPGTRSAVQ